jgi:hypothetical protein
MFSTLFSSVVISLKGRLSDDIGVTAMAGFAGFSFVRELLALPFVFLAADF